MVMNYKQRAEIFAAISEGSDIEFREIAEIYAAVDSGAEIQWRKSYSSDPWQDHTNLGDWNFDYCDYRVKPSVPIKKYQWFLEYKSDYPEHGVNNPIITSQFYANEECVLNDYPQDYYKILGPVLWSIIEVDEE